MKSIMIDSNLTVNSSNKIQFIKELRREAVMSMGLPEAKAIADIIERQEYGVVLTFADMNGDCERKLWNFFDNLLENKPFITITYTLCGGYVRILVENENVTEKVSSTLEEDVKAVLLRAIDERQFALAKALVDVLNYF